MMIALFLGGLVAGFVVGLWLPHQKKVSEREQRIRSRERQLEKARAELASLRSNPDKVERLRTPIKDFPIAVPERADLGTLLERLSEDLSAESVAKQKLQAHTIVEGLDFNRIPLTLQFRGSFESLFGLLNRIEANRRIIRVDRIGAMRDHEEYGQHLLIDLELSTFFGVSRESSS